MANDVAARLKAVRQMHGLSQRELAKRAGVTNGMISLIEQGRVSPSVASLKKVLDGLPMGLAEFFTMDPAGTSQVFYGKDELVELGEADVSLQLVAARRPGRRMAILRETYEPGADTGSDMLRHVGRGGRRRRLRQGRGDHRQPDPRPGPRGRLLFRERGAPPLPQSRARAL